MAESFNRKHWERYRRLAQTILCPVCGMGVGTTCLNMITGEPLSTAAHNLRIDAAIDQAERISAGDPA